MIRKIERMDDCYNDSPLECGGFTAADMMDARQEGRKEAQQLAAVDGAMSPQVAREWLLELMGDYDFTLPSDAFSVIVDALAAQHQGQAIYQIENDPDEWFDVDRDMYEGHDGSRKRILYTTARANMEPLLAEIDALRSRLEDSVRDGLNERRRDEQLEEALREMRQMIRELLPYVTFTKWDALLHEQENV